MNNSQEKEYRKNNEDLQEKKACLLYTSDAADERSSVDLGGRRIIKKKNSTYINICGMRNKQKNYKDKQNK